MNSPSRRPFLSVIVPAHQAAAVLSRSLSALRASTFPVECWELIVIDDASTDQTPLVAGRFADTVVRLGGSPHGPAYARNRGAEVSRGEILVFVDADVAVHPDTLGRFAALFALDATVGAAFGSYDSRPSSPGIVSRYRNLLHHYVHQRGAGEAETFWAGCGAIRGRLFAEVGMFDEWHYRRPQIEDIELGRRIRRRGHRVVLRGDIQATHLKHWTFRDVVRTDFAARGVPWMRLLLREGGSAGPTALNINTRERWCTTLMGVALAAFAATLVLAEVGPAAVGLAALALVLLLNRGFYAFLRERHGPWFVVRAIPLHLMYHVLNGISALSGWVLHHWSNASAPSLERSPAASGPEGALAAGPAGAPAAAPGESSAAAVPASSWPPPPRQPPSSLWHPAAGGTPSEAGRR